MFRPFKYWIALFGFTCSVYPARAAVYLIFYCTHSGYSGHTGIAFDNYNIVIRETYSNCDTTYTYDTIPNGYVTYYDMWPGYEVNGVAGARLNLPAKYHKIPEDPRSGRIFLSDIVNNTSFSVYKKNANGVIKLNTRPYQDWALQNKAEGIIESQKPYNATYYNCTDFVIEIISDLYQEKIRSYEKFIRVKFNTPNQLYKVISKKSNIEIIWDPGSLVNGSILKDRFLYRIFRKKKYNQSIKY